MVYISAVILRKKIPASEYKFRIPGGKGLLCVICIVPCVVAFASFLINGTDYFIGGMLGIISGPILYFIWRKMYGGLSKKDPVAYPNNPRTGLAKNDMTRMSIMFLILGVIGIVGRRFLPWYEGSGGIEEARQYYLDEYGSGLFANWDLMLAVITAATLVCLVIAVVFAFAARRIEK
jgi:amino acid transporter